jgi:hypothetical protein
MYGYPGHEIVLLTVQIFKNSNDYSFNMKRVWASFVNIYDKYMINIYLRLPNGRVGYKVRGGQRFNRTKSLTNNQIE